MKVLMFNGSPHEKGCTYTALNEIAKVLNNEGIETEIFFAGVDPIGPCKACGACKKLGRCVINDKVNEFVDKAEKSDGFIFGTPVHYASASGIITTFLDRAFYAGSSRNVFRLKPGAAIVSARRAGTTATLDQINPEQVMQDEEGMQIMRILGKNMAWYLKCQEAAQKAGILPPEKEPVQWTNFIR